MNELDKMKNLIKEINYYNEYYYSLDNPLISDAEWDKMYEDLLKLEKKLGIVLPDSPTQKVGDKVLKGFKKVHHIKKLYSLDKCNSTEELEDWLNNISHKFNTNTFSLEYKFDGLRIVLTYNNGEFISASTRGNGEIGEDVTEQIKTIKSVPKIIDFKGFLVVMGEAMIKLSDLKKYNEINDAEPLKNARNAAAGAIRNLDLSETKKRNLSLFLYDCLEVSDIKFKNQQEFHDFLIKNNLPTWDYFKIYSNIDELIKEINEIGNQRKFLDILIDGAVIKVNDYNIREEIGYTNKFPKWAIAYKFEALEVSTKVLDVVWQVGRTGKLTPIAELEPVELAGATVKRATLNNFGDIIRKDVKINSRVFVRRSNEVIPEILNVASHSTDSVDVVKPTNCPCCGSELIETNANLFCPNKLNCVNQINERLSHFCSRNAMNIEGVSDKTVNAIREKLNITTVADLYDVTKEELLTLDSFKDKKADNFLNSIENSKNVQFSNFIYAIGINNIGEKTAKDLSKHFNSFDDLKNATIEELININEIGEIIAKSLVDYFANEFNIKVIYELFDKGVKINYNNNVKNNNLNLLNKVFVLTGTLEKYSREEATKILESNGAIVTSSVSKKTDFVLAGLNPGSKIDKANQLGVKIIDEFSFESMLNN